MVGISRSFKSLNYGESVGPNEYQSHKPESTTDSVVHLSKDLNKLFVAEHSYSKKDQSWSSRSESLDISITDWNDIIDLLNALRKFRELPDDTSLTVSIPVDEVIAKYREHPKNDDDDMEKYEWKCTNVNVSARISASIIEFSVRSDEEEVLATPLIPIGDEYSIERGASNTIHLERLIEMIESIDQGIEPSDTKEPTLPSDAHSQLADLEYGYEVIEHTQDGDICIEKELRHLALSSYIHAIEWMAITYLKTEGIDIIEREKDGQYYNFAGGANSILDELKENSDIDQKSISQLQSINSAERRWMAHHKSGEVLPEEVDAIRARLQNLVRDLLLK
jgi:hypothetical protein